LLDLALALARLDSGDGIRWNPFAGGSWNGRSDPAGSKHYAAHFRPITSRFNFTHKIFNIIEYYQMHSNIFKYILYIFLLYLRNHTLRPLHPLLIQASLRSKLDGDLSGVYQCW